MRKYPASYRSGSSGYGLGYSGLRPGQNYVDQHIQHFGDYGQSRRWIDANGNSKWVYYPPYTPPAAPPPMFTPEEAAARRADQMAHYRQRMDDARALSDGYQRRPQDLSAPMIAPDRITGINPAVLREMAIKAGMDALVDFLTPWPVELWDILDGAWSQLNSGGGGGGGSWSLPSGWSKYNECYLGSEPFRWQKTPVTSASTVSTCPSRSIYGYGNGPASAFPVTATFNPTDFLVTYSHENHLTLPQFWWVHYHTVFQYNGPAATTTKPTYVYAQATKGWPLARPYVPPEVWPLARPLGIPIVRGVPLPLGWSNTGKGVQVGLPSGSIGGNGVPPRTPVVSPPRNPGGPGVREKKASATSAVADVYKWAVGVTEFNDLVDCIWSAMPDFLQDAVSRRPGKLTPQAKLREVWKNLDHLDPTKFVECVIYNAVEDAIAGRAFGLGDEGTRRLTGRRQNVFSAA